MINHSNKKITRALLIRKLAHRCQSLDLTTAQQVVDLFFQETIKALSQDQAVTLRGFGTLQAKTRPSGVGHDPKTNKQINLPSRRWMHFKPSKVLCKPLSPEETS